MPEIKPIKVFKREALFLRTKSLEEKHIEALTKKYQFRFYEQKACDVCEWVEERHCDVCDNCAAFQGGADLASQVKIQGKNYLKLPIGAKAQVQNFLLKKDYEFKFINKHPDIEIKKIKFTGELREHQPAAVKAMKKFKRGVLKSPPRSGKTVMATAFVCEVQKKTIIIASQREWLNGFQETFIGSDTQKALTNIKESRIGFAKKFKDFEKYDVCLVTVQTFYSAAGRKLLKKIASMFSVAIFDEVQTTAAKEYAIAIAQLNVEYMIGLSGTPERKDQKDVISTALIGPVFFEVKVEQLVPRIALTRTAYVKTHRAQTPWHYIEGGLERDPARLKLIAKMAVKDAEKGHLVLIPMRRVTSVKALTKAINRLAGETIAAEFYGGLKNGPRKDVIENARKYKIKVVVGNMKLLSTGTNIPRASCLYEVSLSSNIPQCQQRIARILTPFADKPEPLIRIFLDDMKIRKNCLSNEFWNCIKPKFKPHISETDYDLLRTYLSGKDQQNKITI